MEMDGIQVNNSIQVDKNKKNIYIFDLDDTLYQKDEKGDYCNFVDINLLEKLLGTKIMFSNAKMVHCNMWIHKLNINNYFQVILSSDVLQGYKPNPIIYGKLMIYCGLTYDYNIYFFDNLVENLVAAKQLNWTTILIDPYWKRMDQKYHNIYKKFVDNSFDNINDALLTIINT